MRIVRLALIDQYSREPQAGNVPELGVLRILHDLRERRNRIRILAVIDGEARKSQFRLVRVRRIRVSP